MGAGIVFRDEAWEPHGHILGPGVPVLCRSLARVLTDGCGDPPALLLAVGLRMGTRLLSADNLRLMVMAWALLDSLETMRRISGLASPEAVRHRLLRVSGRIQIAIAEEIEPLPPDPARTFVEALRRGDSPSMVREEAPRLRVQIEAALRSIALGAPTPDCANRTVTNAD